MNDKALQRPYQPGIRDQIANGWDAYLGITREVQRRLDVVLGHDTPNWRALNSCPSCQYEVCCNRSYSVSTDPSKLVDEPRLKYRKISIIDGNTSLRRVDQRRSTNKQTFDSDYFIPVDEVDEIEKPGSPRQVRFDFCPSYHLTSADTRHGG